MADDQSNHPLATPPSRSAKRLICYVPIDYVEAMGLAAIGWAHLETAIDVIIALATRALNRSYDGAVSSSAGKIDQLLSLSTEIALENDWRIEIESIARAAQAYRNDIQNAAHGTLYGRGLDMAALELRTLHEKTHSAPVMSRMTKRKVDEAVAGIATETRRALVLAQRISRRCAGPEFEL